MAQCSIRSTVVYNKSVEDQTSRLATRTVEFSIDFQHYCCDSAGIFCSISDRIFAIFLRCTCSVTDLLVVIVRHAAEVAAPGLAYGPIHSMCTVRVNGLSFTLQHAQSDAITCRLMSSVCLVYIIKLQQYIANAAQMNSVLCYQSVK